MSKSPPKIRLRASATWSLASQVVSAIVTLIVGIVVARELGAESKGVLSISQQTVSILLVVLGLGVPAASTYFIASKKAKPNEILGNALLQTCLGAVVAFLTIAVVLSTSDIPKNSVPVLAAASFAYFLFLFLNALISGIAFGLEGVHRVSLGSILSSVLLLILVTGCAAVGILSVVAVMAASAISAAVGCAITAVAIRPYLAHIRCSLRTWKQTASYSFKSFAGEAAGMLHTRQDVLLIGWLLTATAAGIYSVGVSFAELVWFLPTALGTAVLVQAPRHDKENALEFSARGSRVSVVLTFGTALVLSIAVPFVLPLLFGVDFSFGIYVFFALLPGAISDGILRVVNSFALSLEEICWKEQLFGVVLNLCLVWLAAQRFGVLGVAASSSLSYSMVLILVLFRLKRRINLPIREFLIPKKEDIKLLLQEVKSVFSS